MAADVGTGTTITFSSGFLAEILNVNLTGIERGAVDSSHMGTTTARTFIPTDLFDPGGVDVELHLTQDTKPPISGAAETVTITLPDASTWVASGFMTNFTFTDPLEEKMTATATLKLSGDITVT